MNHAERYLDLIDRCPKQLDAEYRAAFYLLSMNGEIYEAAKEHVDVEGIHFPKIHKVSDHMGEYQRKMVRVASNLFNPNYYATKTPTPSDIAYLGAPYVGAVMAALMICAEQAEIKVQTDTQGRPELAIDTTRYYKNLRIYQALTSIEAGLTQDEGEEDALGR